MRQEVRFPARQFLGYIAPAAQIERLKWRCTWCKAIAKARYIPLDIVDREALAQWTPPDGMRKRW